MHISKTIPVTNETPNQYSAWRYCFALVTAFVLADVLTGGLLIESIALHKIEYAVSLFIMIATVGVFASDGSNGKLLVRTFSRQKL
jgi:hypothetical protein